MRLLDASNGKLLAEAPAKNLAPTRCIFSHDGELLIGGGPSGILIWEIRRDDGKLSLHQRPRLKGPVSTTYTLGVTPDGRYLAAACFNEGFVSIWDLKSSEQVARWRTWDTPGARLMPISG